MDYAHKFLTGRPCPNLGKRTIVPLEYAQGRVLVSIGALRTRGRTMPPLRERVSK